MKKYIIPFLFLLNAACQSSAVFEKYQNIPDETWNRYNVVELIANIPDSGLYQVQLCLRHTTDYEMANLWCFITTRSQASSEIADTLNIKVAEPDGRWLGKGNTIKTIEQGIHYNPVILPKGKVIFQIEQGMRLEDIHGVKNIGIKIDRIKK